jgi:hypothetical protein
MNRRDERRSPNKQLVPLVRQDYITKPGGLFEAQFTSGYRTADLSSIHPLNHSSVTDSRLEFSKFLAGTGRKQSSKLEAWEQGQHEAHHYEDKRDTDKRVAHNINDKNRNEKILQRRDNSISLENTFHSKSGELPRPFERRSANQGHDHVIRQSTDYARDSESHNDSSVEREIDISTYIKEQRKLIKRVKSGSKIPISNTLKDSSVHYEIKEFRNSKLDGKRDAYIPSYSSKADNLNVDEDDTHEKFMRQFNKKGSTSDYPEVLFKNEQLSTNKRVQNSQKYHFKTYEEKEKNQDNSMDSDVSKLKERLQLGRSNREMTYGTKENSKGSRIIKRIHVGQTQNFEDVFRDETNSNPKPSRGDTSDDKTQASIGNRYSKPIPTNKGKQLLTSDLSKKSSLDRMALKFNRCNTSTGFERNEPSEGSLDTFKKLSTNHHNYKSNEMLFIGDNDQNVSLAAHFRKKLEKTDSVKFFEKPKNSTQLSNIKASPKVNDTSKLDLRKKMMDYGKRLESSKKPVREIENSISRNNLSISKASSNPNLLAFGQRKASPKPEVLERLARGIKPKVEKSEIHEITRRHIEKFQKLSKQADTPQATQVRKADLIERRNKVKELDMVG